MYVPTQAEPVNRCPWQLGWYMPHKGGKAGRRVFADCLTLNILASCTEVPMAGLPVPWSLVDHGNAQHIRLGLGMDLLHEHSCKTPPHLTFLSKNAPPSLVAGPFPPKAVAVIWEHPLPRRKWASTELAECPRPQTALGTYSDSHQLLPATCTVPVTAWHTPCPSHSVAKCPCHDQQRGPLLVLPWEVRSRLW